MAELVDALGSGSSGCTSVGVRVPLRALKKIKYPESNAMNSFIKFLVFLIFPFTVSLSQNTLSGTVVDSSTNEPLAGVNIMINGTLLGASTDEDGHYRILNIPDGTYEVKGSFIGYPPKTFHITFNKKKNIILDFAMYSDLDIGFDPVIQHKDSLPDNSIEPKPDSLRHDK